MAAPAFNAEKFALYVALFDSENENEATSALLRAREELQKTSWRFVDAIETDGYVEAIRGQVEPEFQRTVAVTGSAEPVEPEGIARLVLVASLAVQHFLREHGERLLGGLGVVVITGALVMAGIAQFSPAKPVAVPATPQKLDAGKGSASGKAPGNNPPGKKRPAKPVNNGRS